MIYVVAENYVNNREKYSWECDKGHQWNAAATDISRGTWCPHCAGIIPKSLEWLQELANKRDGKSLAKVYVNALTKYPWECKQGHRWEAAANNIGAGYWCPYCVGLAPRNIQWLHKLATDRKGWCLSEHYVNNATKYLWKCDRGHEWRAVSGSIQMGRWCPKCAGRVSKPERLLFAEVFKCYPDALSNQTGLLKNKRFELDIYIPSTNKAIEFDGEYWHTQPGNVERDRKKDCQCIEAGIGLLRVSDKDWKTNPKDTLKRVIDFIGS